MMRIGFKALLPRMKEPGILAGWIFGIILVGGLFWLLTQNIRFVSLRESVNRSLAATGEERRLGGDISSWGMSGRITQAGKWYVLEGNSGLGVAFTILSGGTAAPYAALISTGGSVDAIVPLGAHSVSVFNRLPAPVIQIYIRRIEAAAALLAKGGL